MYTSQWPPAKHLTGTEKITVTETLTEKRHGFPKKIISKSWESLGFQKQRKINVDTDLVTPNHTVYRAKLVTRI